MSVPRQRHITPPSATDILQPSSNESRKSSNKSYRSSNTSPGTIDTGRTTPITPSRGEGPPLLPKVRSQDQCLDIGSFVPSNYNSFPSHINGSFSHGYSVGSSHVRRSTTPPDFSLLTPPSSAPYFPTSMSSTSYSLDPNDPFDCSGGQQQTYRSAITYARNRSSSPSQSHSRSASENGVESIIARYGYPTYRQVPTCSASIPASANYATPVPIETLATNYNRTHFASPSLPVELNFESYQYQPPSTTLLDYLTGSNPRPSLVQRYIGPNRLKDTHFWWDIRNVKSWPDFKLDTIMKIPGFAQLLNSAIPEPALPTPGRCGSNPESTLALQDIFTHSVMTKVNRALEVSMGSNPIRIRDHKPRLGERPMPDYISSYDNDIARTFAGEKRGRIVGLVKGFEQWNSGKRAEKPSSTIEYLRELAHLHRFMREHSTRYGFIITEIELICVRAGTETPPHFGYLELAPAIELQNQGPCQLTAALALWYLHMLASNDPLPGQCKWEMNVGLPAELTRQKKLDRDAWMLKPEAKEKRDAKRTRGWVMPEDPFSKKECAKPRRVSRTS